MASFGRTVAILIFCSILGASLFNCGKPKEGKVIISDQEFSIRQDSKYKRNWFVDAKGKVKNVGDADVKNIVVTGYCESCQEAVISGKWFISNIDKMPNQKAVIAYLPVGAEEEFSFEEVALMMEQNETIPDKMPDKLVCKILSFETVQK
jgi:hypothetical protein